MSNQQSADAQYPSPPNRLLRGEHPFDPAAEVVDICRDLIRIDTTNFGDREGPGERKAAEYVATLLDEVGIEIPDEQEDEVEKFREFLDQISPEDFGAGSGSGGST